MTMQERKPELYKPDDPIFVSKRMKELGVMLKKEICMFCFWPMEPEKINRIGGPCDLFICRNCQWKLTVFEKENEVAMERWRRGYR